MIVPRWHDRLLLAGTLAVAAGVVMLRSFAGSPGTAGLALAIVGLAALICGLVWKIREGR